jgi:hypothetical protein
VEHALDDDDRLMLEFMAEQRVAVEPQLRRLLGGAAEVTAQRLAALADGGYLRREAIFAEQPAALWITARGLGGVERRLAAPRRPDLRTYRHDVGVGWLWLAARDGAFGELTALRSERELRARDRGAQAGGGGERLGVRTGGVGPRGGERLHYPDLLLDTATGHRVALELELTAKSATRLDGIMRGYAFERRIDAVVYLVPDRAIGSRVQAAARRAGIGELVHVQRLAPAAPAGAPGAARALGRRATARGGGRAADPSGGSVPERGGGSVPERGGGSVPERGGGSVPERGGGSGVERGGVER